MAPYFVLSLSMLLLAFGPMNRSAIAQKTDRLLIAGHKAHIASAILHEQRAFWVHLPADYDAPNNLNRQYPVIYLLDGESNFMPALGVHAALRHRRVGAIPDAIVVGIINTDRTRDFTPSKAVSVRGAATMENSGGADAFTAFLRDELIPHIDAHYRSSSRRILEGHSFGGLLALHILLTQPTTFTDYLVLDPSLWWDDQKLLKEAKQRLPDTAFEQTRLYLGRASEKRDDDNLPTESAKQLQPAFRQLLEEQSPAGLHWSYQSFPHETHGSLFLPGTYAGLQYIFSE